jgi:predicted nucleic acid-binding protein
MTFTVVYDANVLYPNTLRDLLIRIAQSGTVQAKWTNAILDEMLAALRRNRPDIPAEKFERLRDLMNKAVRDCLMTGHEPLIEGLKLPDPDDRHVLAAAIKAGARSSLPATSRTSPSPTFSRGISRPNHLTRSSSTRCTSISGRWPRPSGRSRTPGPTRPRQSKTSSPNSNETASSNPSPPSARPNVSRSESRSRA